MKKCDFFISYCHADRELAQMFSEELHKKGYSVWLDTDMLTLGNVWADVIAKAIVNCDCFMPIITEKHCESEWCRKEFMFAYEESRSRSKMILPILATKKLPASIKLLVSSMQCFSIDLSDFSRETLEKLVDKICKEVFYKTKTELLYEKISEYKKLNDANKEAEALCELIELTRNTRATPPTKEWCKDMLALYEKLSKYCSPDYEKASVAMAHKILKQLDKTEKIWTGTGKRPPNLIFNNDLFYTSFVLRMIYFDREIRLECADIITRGDAVSACPVSWYIEKQSIYAEAYYIDNQFIDNSASKYTEDELAFIADTAEYIFANNATVSGGQKKNKQSSVVLSKDDEILISIAKFIKEGNKLFDVLRKNGIAGDFLKCLLTSYERLKKYCEIVGASNVASECVDRIVDIRSELDKSDFSGGTQNAKAEKGIKSLLGFTLEDAGNYDVFISFKNEDSDLAEKIYRYCHKNMKVPFWSKKTLPTLSKSEYSKAIDMALENSKHFVVVLSDLKYLNAEWIQYEMDVFNNEIKEGRKQNSNFVIVATDDVYDEIIRSNKTVLDIAYRRYQIIKMREYEELLAQYIS